MQGDSSLRMGTHMEVLLSSYFNWKSSPVGVKDIPQAAMCSLYARAFGTLLALCTTIPFATAQGYVLSEHLTLRTGLSHRWVNHIIQDSRGFLWVATADGLNRFDGHTFVVYRPIDDDSLSNEHANWIYWSYEQPDSKRIVSTRGGMFLFDVKTGRFSRIKIDRPGSTSVSEAVTGFRLRDETETFWKPTRTFNDLADTLVLIDYTDVSARGQPTGLQIHGAHLFLSGLNNTMWYWEPRSGWYLVSLEHGDIRQMDCDGLRPWNASHPLPVDLKTQTLCVPVADGTDNFHHIPLPPGLTELNKDNVFCDDARNWWYITPESPPRLLKYSSDRSLLEIGHLPVPYIYTVYEDQEGTVWVGHQLGITKYIRKQRLFTNALHDPFGPGEYPPVSFSCRSLAEDRMGQLYAENQVTLYALSGADKTAVALLPGMHVTGNEPMTGTPGCVFADREGIIWICIAPGLVRYDPASQHAVLFSDPVIRGQGYHILEDRRGRLWVQMDLESGPRAIVLFDKSIAQFSIPACKDVGIDHGFIQNEEDVIWTFHPRGLIRISCIDQLADSIFLFSENRDQRQVTILDSIAWIATTAGLIRADLRDYSIRIFGQRDGLPTDVIYAFLQDSQYLWLGTGNGLCRFDHHTFAMQSFFTSDGLSHHEFNTRAVLKTADGRYVMGGLNGINMFRPETLDAFGSYQPTLHCVGITRYDAKRQQFDELQPRGEPGTPFIIRHYDRSLAFHFALTSMRNVQHNTYTHFLDGLDQQWSPFAATPVIAYEFLPPGRYTLYVRAKDPSGIESSNRVAIPIIVLRAWYARWWAWTLYALAFLTISFVIYRHVLLRRLEHAETLRLRELDAVKSRIYTNITHEFRTPLTLILGVTRQLLLRNADHNPIQTDLETVQHNGQRLLQLVNQILDLRKLEARQMTLHLVQGDVTPLLRYLFDSFHSHAHSRGIDFRNEISSEQIVMDFDADGLIKIVSNLLSNAIKFTPSGGEVVFKAERTGLAHPGLQIEVTDTGEGIAADHLPKIFNTFFQADTPLSQTDAGTGIGLSLVKELVTLLGGSIDVHSQPGQGSAFVVLLPVTHNAPIHESAWNPQALEQAFATPSTTGLSEEGPSDITAPCILIIEDNTEVARYTASCLGSQYRVIFATNGIDGIAQAYAVVPDLVISDVMMPGKDGFEVTQVLKEDQRTSHIPIILLTARSEVQDRLEGIRRGADVYLSKPFLEEELRIHVTQLLELRRKLQLRYSDDVLLSGKTVPKPEDDGTPFDLDLEDTFVRQVMQCLEENICNSTFTNEDLYRTMLMSRAQLHRKLSALTGRTPNQLLTQCRLQRAETLLREGRQPIAEIALLVGFSDPSYFARVFARAYGQTPSEYRDQLSSAR